MLVTRDMGPLLIAGYASGAFLAAISRDVVAPAQRRSAAAFVLAVGAVRGLDRRRHASRCSGSASSTA